MTSGDELLARAREYAQSKGIELKKEETLGYGSDGTVWQTSRPSALKICEDYSRFKKELTCYQRFAAAGITNITKLAVPVLLDFDDPLMAIEMTIVEPPYLLDFGKVALDAPPSYEFDPQMVANRNAEGRELFGARWPQVKVAMAALRRFNIWYADPRPGNINFGDD